MKILMALTSHDKLGLTTGRERSGRESRPLATRLAQAGAEADWRTAISRPYMGRKRKGLLEEDSDNMRSDREHSMHHGPRTAPAPDPADEARPPSERRHEQ